MNRLLRMPGGICAAIVVFGTTLAADAAITYIAQSRTISTSAAIDPLTSGPMQDADAAEASNFAPFNEFVESSLSFEEEVDNGTPFPSFNVIVTRARAEIESTLGDHAISLLSKLKVNSGDDIGGSGPAVAAALVNVSFQLDTVTVVDFFRDSGIEGGGGIGNHFTFSLTDSDGNAIFSESSPGDDSALLQPGTYAFKYDHQASTAFGFLDSSAVVTLTFDESPTAIPLPPAIFAGLGTLGMIALARRYRRR